MHFLQGLIEIRRMMSFINWKQQQKQKERLSENIIAAFAAAEIKDLLGEIEI